MTSLTDLLYVLLAMAGMVVPIPPLDPWPPT
jgi:hypothetical protein